MASSEAEIPGPTPRTNSACVESDRKGKTVSLYPS
jgi:hypothetical protein